MNKKHLAYLKLIGAMFIFGSIGVFVRNISWQSSALAMFRAVIGTGFLLIISLRTKRQFSFSSLKKNLPMLFLSGIALGFNWIALFEAYKHTSVAIATLCYYTAPILVILISPLLLKEKLTVKKILCVLIALLGMMLVSRIFAPGQGSGNILGILLGLGAAVLYASVVLLNKYHTDISAFDRTIFQLGFAAIALLPYNLFNSVFPAEWPGIAELLLLLTVGIVHTGLAYFMYFSALEVLSGQTVAIISYLDPIVAVLASVLILHESTTAFEVLGAVLILGSAVCSEISTKKRGIQA